MSSTEESRRLKRDKGEGAQGWEIDRSAYNKEERLCERRRDYHMLASEKRYV